MQAVILAGGLGSRISEETYLKPKPMVTVGNKPILWHILKKFSQHGIDNFVICLGYKGNVIKEYFLNYKSYNSDIKVSLPDGKIEIFDNDSEHWKVSLIDTGEYSNTGERLKRVEKFITDKDFFFTYGDGLTDQNLNDTFDFHKVRNSLATMTAVYPPARYGAVEIAHGTVLNFSEKSSTNSSYINGGFFVLNKDIFRILDKYTNPSWEVDILPKLSNLNKLNAFEHNGFWFAMDTLRDKEHLEEMLRNGSAPWLQTRNLDSH